MSATVKVYRDLLALAESWDMSHHANRAGRRYLRRRLHWVRFGRYYSMLIGIVAGWTLTTILLAVIR